MPPFKILFSLACAAAALVPLGATRFVPSNGLPAAAEIDTVMSELSFITGFPVKHHLRFESITRDQINRFLNERAQQSIHDKQIESEQTALQMLGFVPPDFDLRKTTVDLLTEQAAAFYDYHRKKLFIADWTPGEMRNETVIHELSHALADQNFDLGRFEKKVENDSERSAAREAVVEGQATYLTLAYAAAMRGEPPLKVKPDREEFEQLVKPSGEFPVFDSAPLYFRTTLVFPYTWGVLFQAAVVQNYGRAGFSTVFRDPPVSTQQILHPDLYFSHSRPEEIDVPDPPPHSKPLLASDLGELEHRILLEQYCSRKEAERVGPDWRGGGFALFSLKHTERKFLEYASAWSNAEAAARFLTLYERILKGKMHNAVIDRASTAEFSGHSDGGFFRVWRVGNRVSSVENMPAPLSRD